MVDPVSRVLGLLDKTRWVNMYRLTDPIGGAISGETLTSRRGSWQPETGLPVTAEIPDVTSTLHNPVSDPDLRLFAGPSDDPHVYPKKGDPYPQPLGHSDYNRAPEFKASLRSLLGLPD